MKLRNPTGRPNDFPTKMGGRKTSSCCRICMCVLECAGCPADSVPKNKPETQFIKELYDPQLRELKFHIHYQNDAFLTTVYLY